jgi:transcriptional regulator with XRE-family HTH domain
MGQFGSVAKEFRTADFGAHAIRMLVIISASKLRKGKRQMRQATTEDAFVGKKIRGYRNRLKLSQGELGEQIGVTFQQVQKYEKGHNRVSGVRLSQIAAIFQCEITDLLPARNKNGKSNGLTSVDRMVATHDGMKLIESFVTIKNSIARAAIVDMARRFEGF